MGKGKFDYLAAKKDGYTDEEIQQYLKQSGRDFDLVNAKNDGYTDEEIASYLSGSDGGVKKKEAAAPTNTNVASQSMAQSSPSSVSSKAGGSSQSSGVKNSGGGVVDYFKGMIQSAGENVKIEEEETKEQLKPVTQKLSEGKIGGDGVGAYLSGRAFKPKATKEQKTEAARSIVDRMTPGFLDEETKVKISEQVTPLVRDEDALKLAKDKEDKAFISGAGYQDILRKNDELIARANKSYSRENAIAGIEQSRTGKVAGFLRNVLNGDDINPQDEAYLQQYAPNAYKQILDSKKVNNLAEYAELRKPEVAQLRIQAAQQEVWPVIAQFKDVKGLGTEMTSMPTYARQLAESEQKEIDAIGNKYPLVAEKQTGWGGGMDAKYAYTTKRDSRYEKEVGAIKQKYQEQRDKAGLADGIAFAANELKTKGENIDPLKVGEQMLKTTNPVLYAVYAKGGKQSKDFQQNLYKAGVDVMRNSGVPQLYAVAQEKEKQYDKLYPEAKEKDVVLKLAIEKFKRQGGAGTWGNSEVITIKEGNELASNLNANDKLIWERIKSNALNNKTRFTTDAYTREEAEGIKIGIPPIGGGINEFYKGLVSPIEGIANTIVGVFDSKEQSANKALKDNWIKQKLVDRESIQNEIQSIESKKSLTSDDAKRLIELKSQLGLKSKGQEYVDLAAFTTGQVGGQAGLSLLGGGVISNVVGKYAPALSNISKIEKGANWLKDMGNAGKLAGAEVAYLSSYGDAKIEANRLMPDANEGWKMLYANIVGFANAGTEHIFPDQKILDALKKEVSPSIAALVNNLSRGNITEASFNSSLKSIFKNAFTKYLPQVIIEGRKEDLEELTTSILTTAAKTGMVIGGVMDESQLNFDDEVEGWKQTIQQSAIGGSVASVLGGIGEVRRNTITKNTLYNLSKDPTEMDKLSDVIRYQQETGVMSERDAIDKLQTVSMLKDIGQRAMPVINEKVKLTEPDKAQLTALLLAENKLQSQIKNPNYKDIKSVLEKDLAEVEKQKDAIINGKVVIDDDLNAYTPEEWAKKNKAETQAAQESRTAVTDLLNKQKQAKDDYIARNGNPKTKSEVEAYNNFQTEITTKEGVDTYLKNAAAAPQQAAATATNKGIAIVTNTDGTFDVVKENGEKENFKTQQEADARVLELSQEAAAQPTVDIGAKKYEIETKRKEELDSLPLVPLSLDGEMTEQQKNKLEKENEINAKYDAELAELEKQAQPAQTQQPIGVVEKQDGTFDVLNPSGKTENFATREEADKKALELSQQQAESKDIKTQSQEEFAQYLQDNHSDELSQEQIYKLLTVRPELRERMLNESPQEWAKIFEKNIDYRQQANNVDNNKEMRGNANPAWVGISIGDTSNKESDGRHKGYVTLNVDSAREMGKNLEQTFKDLYKILKESGYNGHLKMPSVYSDLLTRFDNIVIHGATKEDVSLALPIIEQYFKEKGLIVEGTKTGIDAKNSNGKETSHTNLLAEKVKNKQLTKQAQPAQTEAKKPSPLQQLKQKKDAVQKQEAGQVSVQPTTGVSGEVAQGVSESEPQGTPQEGKTAAAKVEEKISNKVGESVTIKVGGKPVSGVVSKDEGGKLTIESRGRIIEVDDETPFVEYANPIRVLEKGKGIEVNDELFTDVMFVEDEKGEAAWLQREDGTFKKITTPEIVEELKYQTALKKVDEISDTEAYRINKQYESERKTPQPSKEGTDKGDGGLRGTSQKAEKGQPAAPELTDEERRLKEALDELDLIEKMADEELAQVESSAKLVQVIPTGSKEPKAYLVKKNKDGKYSATKDGRKVKEGAFLTRLGEAYEAQTEQDVKEARERLKQQVADLKEEVEAKFYGREPKKKGIEQNKKLPNFITFNNEYEKQGLQRLSEEGERGRKESGGINAVTTIIANQVHRAVQEEQGVSNPNAYGKIKELEQSAIEEYANENGLMVELPKGEVVGSGNESDVYLNDNDSLVTKVTFPNNYNSWLEFMDSIAIHNAENPNAKIKIIGFTKNKDGEFSIVTEQQKIEGEPAPFNEIHDDLINKGYELSGEYGDGRYVHNDKGIVLEDVKEDNVLKDKNGNLFYIDTDYYPNDKLRGGNVNVGVAEYIPLKAEEEVQQAPSAKQSPLQQIKAKKEENEKQQPNNISPNGEILRTPTNEEELAAVEREIELAEKRLDEEEKKTGIRTGFLPISNIRVRPDVFQFKAIEEEGGINKAEKLQGEFDENLAGTVAVWEDTKGELGDKGDIYVVDGHHRMEFAKRSGKNGISVFYIDAPNAKAARVIGAKANISQGRGTSIDAAKVFRDATPEQMEGFKPTSLVSKEGKELAKLVDSVFERIAKGQLVKKVGIAVAQISPEFQESALPIVAKFANNPIATQDKLIRFAKKVEQQIRNGNVEAKMVQNLFGEEMQLDVETAAIVEGEIVNAIKSDARLFSAVKNNKEVLEEANNQIDVEVASEEAQRSKIAAGLFEKYIGRASVNSIYDAAIKAYQEAKTKNEKQKIINNAANEIKDAIKAEFDKDFGGDLNKAGQVVGKPNKQTTNEKEVFNKTADEIINELEGNEDVVWGELKDIGNSNKSGNKIAKVAGAIQKAYSRMLSTFNVDEQALRKIPIKDIIADPKIPDGVKRRFAALALLHEVSFPKSEGTKRILEAAKRNGGYQIVLTNIDGDFLIGADDKKILVNPKDFFGTLSLVEDLGNYIQGVAQEEVIHLLANKLATDADYQQVYDEMTDEERDGVTEIYGQATPKNIGAEYVRMYIQNNVFGTLTEKEGTKNKGLLKIINKVVDFLNGLIKEKPNAKILEIVKRFENAVNGVQNEPISGTQLSAGAKPQKTITRKAFDKLMERIKKAFPKSNFFSDEKTLKEKIGKYGGGESFRTQEGIVYGAKFPDGSVYINPDYLSAEAPIHEASHLWEAMMPKEWAEGLAIFKDTTGFKKALKEVEKNKFYNNLTKAQKESEALNTLIGQKGEGYYKSGVMLSRFKAWMDKFFKTIGDKLGLRNLTPDDKLSFFVNGVLGDVMGGKEIVQDNKIEQENKGIQLMKMPNGDLVSVKKIEVDVVNGFYSPLEKVISETKFDKLPAKQWLDKFAKGEEAKWTGLQDWLAQQQGSVSKSDIQQFLKDNRIEIVEVIKGGSYGMSKSDAEKVFKDNGYDVFTDSNGDVYVEKNEEILDYDDMSASQQSAFDVLSENNTDRSDTSNDTKFSQYQLEGEKENYKEVLVTIPIAKSKQEYVVEQDYRTPNTFYAVNQKTGAKLKFGSYELAKSQAERLSKEAQPDFDKQFKSTHFDEPNILVHLRMNTRTDSDGNKILFLEEIQSDWGQKGKKEGFRQDDLKLTAKKASGDNRFDVYQGDRLIRASVFAQNAERAISYIENNPNEYGTNSLKTPTAPFVTDTSSWVKLGLKVALKEAVKQGADKIGWTTGEQQNDRYDLSKQVNRVYGENNGDGTYMFHVLDKNNSAVVNYKATDLKTIEDTIGKDFAERISKESGKYDYQGLDLKVGGKGMKGFYGSPSENNLGIVGNVAKSLFKQEPKTTKIEVQKQDVKLSGQNFDMSEAPKDLQDLVEKYSEGIADGDYAELRKLSDEAKLIGYEIDYELDGEITSFKRISGKPILSTQHSIDITPEMKSQVEAGQPLFMASQTKQVNESIKKLDELSDKINKAKDTAAIKEAQSAYEAELKKDPKIEYLITNFGGITDQLQKLNLITKKGDC